jgi:hypothetical protein
MKLFPPLFLILLVALSPGSALSAVYSSTVIDAASKAPIEGAFVTFGNSVARTDRNGKFQIDSASDTLGIRAYGHQRREVPVTTLTDNVAISLIPFAPKALYLSFYGIGDKHLREAALKLIKDTEINALVIDIKGDRGIVSFKSSTPLATKIGAQKITTIKDIKSLLSDLHAKGIYTIARIVVFKDDLFASANPSVAVKTSSGTIWRDREGLAWPDPFSKMAWDYNVDLAVEAARAGFDEIQFDYVRFPDTPNLHYSMPNTEATRVWAISSFFAEARKKLIPYNVFLAADIFGYAAWNTDDTHIGQKLENLAEVLDYMSPMLYPSGFQFGIPGYLNPIRHPGEIVYHTLEKAKKRTGLPAMRFRPWLQAFPDYAFDKMPFRGAQIRAQIDAADSFGSDGWMLWNPHNKYGDGLRPKH